MKGQWGLIIGLIVALIIASFSIINMDVVSVNYVLGTAQWPLVMVIISSVLMGGILVGVLNVYGTFKLRSKLKKLNHENEDLQKKLAEIENELGELKKQQADTKEQVVHSPNSKISESSTVTIPTNQKS